MRKLLSDFICLFYSNTPEDYKYSWWTILFVIMFLVLVIAISIH